MGDKFTPGQNQHKWVSEQAQWLCPGDTGLLPMQGDVTNHRASVEAPEACLTLTELLQVPAISIEILSVCVHMRTHNAKHKTDRLMPVCHSPSTGAKILPSCRKWVLNSDRITINIPHWLQDDVTLPVLPRNRAPCNGMHQL